PVEDEDVHFTTHEETSADSHNQWLIQYLKGPAGGTVTITVIDIDTDFFLKVNDVDQLIGYTFDIVLDGSGNGYFNVHIGGTVSGLAKVQITSVDIGAIGSPDNAQWNKVIF